MILALLSLLSQDPAACSFDTAARVRPDTVILGLVAAPAKKDASRELLADYLLAAGAIREQFSHLTMLRLPFATRVVNKNPKKLPGAYAPYGLHGFVRFQLNSDGKVVDTTIVVSSASPDVTDAVVAAIHLADSAYAFPPPSRALLNENGQISLRFVDTVETKDPSVALARLIIPTVPLDDNPSVLDFRMQDPGPQGPPPPVGAVRVTGRARGLLEFIIDTDSTIAPGSLHILESPSSAVTTGALEGLKRARFRPGKIGRCLVPSLVRLPIEVPERMEITGEVRSVP